MRRAWAGEAVTLDDDPEHAIEVYPRPLQQPAPPIWVAAFGPKALAQAGGLGLPYLSSPMESLDTLRENYAQHQAAATAAGVSPPDVLPLMRTVFVSRDAAQCARLRDTLSEQAENSRLQAGESLDDWTIIGEPEFVRERVQMYQESLGMTHMIATRIRVGGIEEPILRRSVGLLAETLDGL